MIRNEAAERLYAALHDEAPDDSWQGEMKELAREALATERRLTVEKVRAAILNLLRHHRHHYVPNPLQPGPCDKAQYAADSILDNLATAAVDEEEGK